jgi:hypothetical protein
MSETLPVPVDRLCRAVGRKREPCRNYRSEGSDYCYRHQALANKPASRNEGSPAPFPEVGDPEELTTPAGIHAYMARIAAYISANDQADLPRVYALQAYTTALLRSVEPAQLALQLAEARQEAERLTRIREELLAALERERHRPQPPSEAELQTLRAATEQLKRRNAELERAESRHLEEREELEVLAEEHRQLREAAEKNLATHLERLRKAHNTLCYGCGVRLRPLVGGEPQPGDIDHVERTEYIGRTGNW